MHWYRSWFMISLMAFVLLVGGCIVIDEPPEQTPPITSVLSPTPTKVPTPTPTPVPPPRSVSSGGSPSNVSTPATPPPTGKADAPVPPRVLETKTQDIDPSGGTIGLKDGISIVVPAGAVDAVTRMTINRLDPASYFEIRSNVHRILLKVTSPVTAFKQNVEVRVPLPAWMTEKNSSLVLAGFVDEASGDVIIQRSQIRIIGGKPLLVLPTNHFSTLSFEITVQVGDLAKLPDAVSQGQPGRISEGTAQLGELPYRVSPLNIPYYGQGVSQYCWAATIQMLTQAVRFNDNAEVFDIIGLELFRASPFTQQFGQSQIGETGMGVYEARFSINLANLIERRTGLRPDRTIWDFFYINYALDYIKREIVSGRPVALFSSAWKHVAVVVGYDGDRLYINDPSESKPTDTGYTPYQWGYFTAKMGVGDKITLVSIPGKNLDPNRPEVTVNITDQAFVFEKPQHGDVNGQDYDGGENFRFVWDYSVPGGYSIRGTKIADAPLRDKRYLSLPGHTKQVKVVSKKIEIVNSSRTATKTVTVLLDIVGMGKDPTHYVLKQVLSMPPNSLRYLSIGENEIEIDKFRDNNQGPTEYVLHATALDGEKLADWASITFSIDKEDITIDSLDKKQGPVGTRVTIKGRGFGTVQGSSSEKTFETANDYGKVFGVFAGKASQVTFNRIPATKVISWKDDTIIVEVPTGATTGDVIIQRGTVVSNPKVFIVDAATLSTAKWVLVKRSVSQLGTPKQGQRGSTVSSNTATVVYYWGADVSAWTCSWPEPPNELVIGQKWGGTLTVQDAGSSKATRIPAGGSGQLYAPADLRAFATAALPGQSSSASQSFSWTIPEYTATLPPDELRIIGSCVAGFGNLNSVVEKQVVALEYAYERRK